MWHHVTCGAVKKTFSNMFKWCFHISYLFFLPLVVFPSAGFTPRSENSETVFSLLDVSLQPADCFCQVGMMRAAADWCAAISQRPHGCSFHPKSHGLGMWIEPRRMIHPQSSYTLKWSLQTRSQASGAASSAAKSFIDSGIENHSNICFQHMFPTYVSNICFPFTISGIEVFLCRCLSMFVVCHQKHLVCRGSLRCFCALWSLKSLAACSPCPWDTWKLMPIMNHEIYEMVDM